MKDLPTTFGSNDINNFKQITTTTKTETTGNIPAQLTASQIKKIVDMKDLPETLGSSSMNNIKKTTVTTTTTNTPINVDIKGLPSNLGNANINNFKQTTTTTKTETTGNIPGVLTSSQIQKIIDMKDLPETFGSSNITNNKKTTVTTKTVTTNPVNIDLKQFGLEQNPSMGQFSSDPIDLKQFGLESNMSQISNVQNKKVTTTKTKTVQNNLLNPTQNYSKSSQNIQTTSTPINLQQFGLEKNASNISNILQGSNITFKQPGQSIASSTNYGIPSASTPIIANDDYSKYFNTTKETTTTSINKSGIPITTKVNPVINLTNYSVNIPQGKTTTTTTTTKTTGIPISSSAVTQKYNYPANYTTNKITTTKITKNYVGPTTQTSSYNYSYNIPTTTTNTSINK